MNSSAFSAAIAPPAPPKAGVSWPMASFALALAVQLVGLIAWLAVLDNRLATIERQLPPGAIASLQTEVTAIKDTVGAIDRRLEARRP